MVAGCQKEYEQSKILEESNLHSTVYFRLTEKPRSKEKKLSNVHGVITSSKKEDNVAPLTLLRLFT